jgi:hypothetical protein
MSMRTDALLTTTVLGAATIGSAVAALSAASTAATVAYATLTALGAALSIASITAWAAASDEEGKGYFSTLREHATYAMAAGVQVVAQSVAYALMQGFVNAVRDTVYERFTGNKPRTISVIG